MSKAFLKVQTHIWKAVLHVNAYYICDAFTNVHICYVSESNQFFFYIWIRMQISCMQIPIFLASHELRVIFCCVCIDYSKLQFLTGYYNRGIEKKRHVTHWQIQYILFSQSTFFSPRFWLEQSVCFQLISSLHIVFLSDLY